MRNAGSNIKLHKKNNTQGGNKHCEAKHSLDEISMAEQQESLRYG